MCHTHKFSCRVLVYVLRAVAIQVLLRNITSLQTLFTPNIILELQLHLCSPTCITSAPWTRKMPGRSLCPKAAEARGRRQGAGRRRACPAWHVGIAWPFRRALLSHAHPSPLGSQRIIAQIFGACGIQTDIYRSQHSTSRLYPGGPDGVPAITCNSI